MKPAEIVLAAMSTGGANSSWDSLRIQKLLFLIDVEIPDLVGGPHFRFAPYYYGPFDKAVYRLLEELQELGQVAAGRRDGYRQYSLTPEGRRTGERIAGGLPEPARQFMMHAARWLQQSTFRRILTVIYRKYPEMARNTFEPGLRPSLRRSATRGALPSFLTGVARLFDFTGVLDRPLYEGDGAAADARAIRSDWEAVGGDLEDALAAFGPPEPAR